MIKGTDEYTINLIASVLDYPSVYMGGPSHHNKRNAERIIKALREDGFDVIQTLSLPCEHDT
jgi:hypothetical protein